MRLLHSHTNCYNYVVAQCHLIFTGLEELGIFVPLPDESLLDSHKGHNRYSLPQPKRWQRYNVT